MKKYYQILGLDEDASISDVENKYHILIKEFNPSLQEDVIKHYFKSEIKKINDAYSKILLNHKKNGLDSYLNTDETNEPLLQTISDAYKSLKIDESSTLVEINIKYNVLLEEYNPEYHSDELKAFFKSEQEKIINSYNQIIKYLSNLNDENLNDENFNESNNLSNSNNSQLSKQEDIFKDPVFSKEHEINDNISTENYIVDSALVYSWWKYDDEYINGSQYFVRSIVGALLAIILVGFYLQSVTAYKRAKSLGNSSSTCNFYSVWGFLSMFIGMIPVVSFINLIPHWYLWFSNGDKSSDEYVSNLKV